jgi:hypothetical protein
MILMPRSSAITLDVPEVAIEGRARNSLEGHAADAMS